MKAHITAEPSSSVVMDTEISGEVMDSNGVMLSIMGNDGYRYTVEHSSNGNSPLLVMHDSGRRSVKGVVTECFVESNP